ncbi:MAG: hypothetical protein K2N79_04860 [Muribaculaceae bacterium]|nr:hypothetical protein [Muribaculaceae bacterium]MDE5845015.1 hypothetical protein [Muribaculaceae bacterium]MDE7155598.1 hypothetical protein [Muribaculaceae bacterium]MDE7369701.1 hypothetical protein [Muribaculaceae bacterium]
MVETLRRHPLRIISIVFAVAICAAVIYLIARPSVTEAHPDLDNYPVKGLDLSAHNGDVNFDSIAVNYDFVILKATEGGNWTDRSFETNFMKAREAGLKVGAYHYFRFDRDGLPQAINIYNTLYNKRLDLPVAIDVEDHGNPQGIDRDIVIGRLRQLVDFLVNHNIRLMFYTNKLGYNRYVEDDFSGYPLWISSFSDPPIHTPWTLWQYTHSGKVVGVPGLADINLFNGSENDFEKFIN